MGISLSRPYPAVGERPPCERLTIGDLPKQVFALYRIQGRSEKSDSCSAALFACLGGFLPGIDHSNPLRSRTLNASTRNTDLNRLRALQSWSQRQLTDRCGLSRPLLSRYESRGGAIQRRLKGVPQ